MLTVRFVDHSDQFLEKLRRKLKAAVVAAASELSEGYRTELQREQSPLHSATGQIPHAYVGWLPGGYGPTNETGVNNIPPEFAGIQTAPLASYIDYGSDDLFGIGAYVGFLESHVNPGAGFDGQNYLLEWDRSGRPWIQPIFDTWRVAASAVAMEAFKVTQ